ncbi:MAG: hypothetical protein E6Q71_06100 [Pseudomonas sp.]|nr:MAG: hypothetical protein E6Q71_06100 [Pseudomonas sp.]
MGRLAQIIMNQKPLSASELEKAKASHAVREAQKKEQQVKRAVGVDKIEREVDKAVRASAEASTIASASPLDTVHTLHPALLAKVGRNEKLTTNEQKELANFFRLVGWL